MLRALRLGVVCCFAIVSFPDGSAQTARNPTAAMAARPELRAARAFDTAKKSPLELHAFLEKMPKGADLHMHLSGAIYAETFLRDAREDLLCVNPAGVLLKAPAFTPRLAAALPNAHTHPAPHAHALPPPPMPRRDFAKRFRARAPAGW